MGYELHIERMAPSGSGRNPISAEEWQDAVSNTKGLRFTEAKSSTATNPKTGDIITISLKGEGHTEVYFPDEKKWVPVFFWAQRSAKFKATCRLGDKSDPVWAAAVTLAKRLDASIAGDEGEIYDLETGVPSSH